MLQVMLHLVVAAVLRDSLCVVSLAALRGRLLYVV